MKKLNYNSDIHQKFRELMRRHKCECVNVCDGPDGVNPSRMEFWTVPGKGMIVAQVWEGDEGVTTFADWPTGSDWDDLIRCIMPKRETV